jgi:hypothetical protein
LHGADGRSGKVKTVAVDSLRAPKESGKKVPKVAPVGFPPVTRGHLRRVGDQIAELPGGETVSLMEAARRLDIYVMTSASIYQGQLARNLPPIIGEFLPGLETDAQRALQFVRSTPGVGTALVGMKQPIHVEEIARVSAVPPLGWDQFKTLFSEA